MTTDRMRPPVGRKEFTELLGISKSTFYNKYRWSPKWQRELDMRIGTESGRLTMDRDAVEDLARRRRGSRTTGRSARAERLGDHGERDSGTDA